MKQYCDLYQLDNIKAIPCTMIGNEITFPFVEGSSYSYLLLQAIKKGDKQKVYELLFEYKKIIYNLGKDARTFQVNLQRFLAS